jgi:xylan 1,4-beta-xylosidase
MLQRTGHGQTVETPAGQWYHTHLCSRPLPGTRRSPLGRETGIQLCSWGEDGWLRLAQGARQAELEVPAPDLVEESFAESASQSAAESDPSHDLAVDDSDRLYRFRIAGLPLDFQWLRSPHSDRLFSLIERPGFLRLYGRESVGSWFEQALVARRLQHHHVSVSTCVDFDPQNFQQSAGLVAYYNRHKFHFLHVSHDETQGRVLGIMSCTGDWPDQKLEFPIEPIELVEPTVLVEQHEQHEQDEQDEQDEPLLHTDETDPRDSSRAYRPLQLRCDIQGPVLRFYWRYDGDWQSIGPSLDASVLSDEGGRGEHGSFTGCFVGMMAFDISGQVAVADFSEFNYRCRKITLS